MTQVKSKRDVEVFNEELVTFAYEFSEKYKTLGQGYYTSDNRKYHLYYLDILSKDEEAVYFQVNNKNGKIQIKRSIISNENITNDFVFYIILHLATFYSKFNKEYILSDKSNVEYYLQSGRSKENLIKGLEWIFAEAKILGYIPSKERIEKLNKILDSKITY